MKLLPIVLLFIFFSNNAAENQIVTQQPSFFSPLIKHKLLTSAVLAAGTVSGKLYASNFFPWLINGIQNNHLPFWDDEKNNCDHFLPLDICGATLMTGVCLGCCVCCCHICCECYFFMKNKKNKIVELKKLE